MMGFTVAHAILGSLGILVLAPLSIAVSWMRKDASTDVQKDAHE